MGGVRADERSDAASDTRFQAALRGLTWAAGGACLSPLVGVPIWMATEGTRFADFVPVISIVHGATAGVVALVFAPGPVRSGATTIFAIVYPATVGVWLAVTGSVWGLLIFTLPAIVASAMLVARGPGPLRSRERSWLAVAAWVLVAGLMLALYFGVVLIPLAVALTFGSLRATGGHTVVRSPGRRQRSER